MWSEIVHFLPVFFTALLVVIVGAIIASSLKHLVERLFLKLKVNEALQAANVGSLVERAGMRLDAGAFVGTLVKWFVLLVFFVVALDMLRLSEVTIFLREVVIGYLPRVIVAVLILVAAAIIAGIARRVVTGAVEAAGMQNAFIFGKATYVAIITFAILAALNQLQIATELVQTFFTGLVFAISLALGLAFGLGGKETAQRYLDSITRR
jgi:hypothetical protein